MNDVLRFALVVPDGPEYRQVVGTVLAELEKAGYSVPDRACKNFWRRGNRFYGFNCTVRSPGGAVFELQLHTESSKNAWSITHESYERLRSTAQPPNRRVHAFLEMLSVNKARGLPDHVPPDLHVRFPAKDATFAKWILSNGPSWRSYLHSLALRGRTFPEVAAELGLRRSDFPLLPSVVAQMEKADVDLLRRVPE